MDYSDAANLPSQPIFGRRHSGEPSNSGYAPSPLKVEIPRSLEDDEQRTYVLLSCQARRILFSGRELEDLTEREVQTVRQWVTHPETQRRGTGTAELTDGILAALEAA